MQDNNSKPLFTEIIKYPMMALSILIFLFGSKHLLGVDFGLIKKIGSDGIEFAERKTAETVNALAGLEGRLNKALIDIETLKKAGTSSETPAEDKILFTEASETVSDQTASIQPLREKNTKNDDQVITGYIWIGNFNDGWNKPRLSSKDSGQPISVNPDNILPGTEYKVLGNMVLRDGLPPNNDMYYRGLKSLGIIPRGGVIRVIDTPAKIQRDDLQQIWVKIELAKGSAK